MCLDEWNPALDASLFLYSATSWYFADFIVKKSLFKGRNPRTRVVDRSRRTRWHINGMTGDGDKCERAGWVSEATLMDTRSWDETTIRETLLNGDVTMHSVLELLLSLFQSYRRHHRPYLSLSHTHAFPWCSTEPAERYHLLVYYTPQTSCDSTSFALCGLPERREWQKMPFQSM